LRPRLGAVAVVILVSLTVVAPFISFSAVALDQGVGFFKTLSTDPTFSPTSLTDRLSRSKLFFPLGGTREEIQEKIRTEFQNVTRSATQGIVGVLGALPKFFVQLMIALVGFYFFLVDGRKFLVWMSDKVPLDPEVRLRVLRSFKTTTAAAFRATLLVAVSQGAAMFLSFLALGIPAGYLAAGAAFIFAWIPLLGSAPVTICAIVYLVSQGLTTKAIVMGGLGVLISLLEHIIRAYFMKGRAHMHPMVALLAAFGGLELFGLLGIFMGPMLATILISLLEIWSKMRNGEFHSQSRAG
jgi:predicted PurR-regulated permease PerM